ncbi:MAG TPA: stalk domain-containing protein [Caldisericia bacterium]|mgnify:FL=1|nr:stalk domain-containing protein [Caldisericia bacterium]HOC78714.1 stalk domain-containing protein [Caldisericia bacterium]HOG70232.1 stalk domain-containing protein [Caldisericia bacterium]HPA66324.1 stalk domain-containing protein [Caldisericia bacterium]HQL68103.1 stalk domain-containing protein [Caldisericia bacterium]
MKKILAFVVVALIALSPMVLVEAGNNEATDWFCFQKDHQRTGTAFFSEKISTPLTQAWDGIIDTNIYIAQNIDPVKGTIIIGKDIAVAATEKGRIGAFSTLDGKPVWRRDIGLPLTTDMALSDEVLLVPLKGGKVLGLDLYTGGTFWEYQAKGEVKSPPLPYNGYFYFPTTEGKLVQLTSASGLVSNEFNMNVNVQLPMAVQPVGYSVSSYAQMIMNSSDGNMVAYNPSTKDFDWQMKLDSPTAVGPLPVGESIIVCSKSGQVSAYALSDRKKFWSYDTKHPIVAAPCRYYNATYVGIGTEDGQVFCIRLGDGNAIWDQKAAGPIKQAVIGINQNLVAVTENGHIQAFFAFDGTVIADVDLKDNITTPPSYSSGSIFVGTKSGRVICVRPKQGSLSLRLDPSIVFISPTESKSVKIRLGSIEGDSNVYYLSNSGFPCRCKLARNFMPSSTMKATDERTLDLKADPSAEPATYEYLVTAMSQSSSEARVSATGICIVVKPEDIMKSYMRFDTSKKNQLVVTVGYENQKFMKSFAGKIIYDPAILRPVETKSLLEGPEYAPFFDLTTKGEVGAYMGFSPSKAKEAKADVFQVTFDVVKSAKTNLKFNPISRTMSSYILPTTDTAVDVEVVRKMTEHVVKLQIGNVIATVDGKQEKLAIAPYIKSGRTMVPLRFVGTALGSKVDWIAEEKAVLYTNSLPTGARTIKLWIGKKVALVDGKEVAIDPPPELVKGNTCVGLSFVSTNFGAKIAYDSKTKTVTINFEN